MAVNVLIRAENGEGGARSSSRSEEIFFQFHRILGGKEIESRRIALVGK